MCVCVREGERERERERETNHSKKLFLSPDVMQHTAEELEHCTLYWTVEPTHTA